MVDIKTIDDIKPFQKPQDSIFAKLINRKFSRFITFYLVKYHKSITPPQITWFSFIISTIGCALFLHPNYWWRLVGIFFLQLGFTLDCCDGEVARLKNNGSKYGAWLDSVFDRIKEVLMLGAITANWYFYKQSEIWVIVVGMLAIIGMQIVAYLREAKKSSWPTTRTSELFISKNIYIGTVDVTIYLVWEIFALVVFLIVSIPMMIKQFLSAFRQSKRDL